MTVTEVHDVARAAWAAHGSPVLAGLPWIDKGSWCARCGRGGVSVDASKVVSEKWAGWDSWRRSANARLCAGCVWAYRAPGLRAGMFWVTQEPRFEIVTAGRVCELLRQPIPEDSAVVVPLRFNRKHVVPQAQWGTVRVDDVSLPWTRGDADRLAAVLRLRSDGFGGRMLALTSPPWPVLSKIGLPRRAEVFADWHLLDRWRPAHPGFDLAVVLSRPADTIGRRSVNGRETRGGR